MSKEQNTEKVRTLQKLTGKQLGIAGGILVVLFALVVGIMIYNAPGNRLSRQLDLGQKYLEEQNYEQAAIAFEEAIVIDDRCMEAYAGGIEAYLGLGDMERLTAFYDKALDAIEGLDESELQEHMDAVVEIYLAAAEVYDSDIEKAIEILERGYDKTKDQRLQDKIDELMARLSAELQLQDETDELPARLPAELVLQLPDTEYDGYGYASGGVILVQKDGLLGAINYRNEIIVPFEYDGWQSMDDYGNFVLVKASDVGGWTYYVFDANGNMIQESYYDTIVSDGMYIQNCYEGDRVDSSIDYYNMDGTLAVSLPYVNEVTGTSDDDWVLSIHGFYDGTSITDCMEGSVGAVDHTGNVQWSEVQNWSVGDVSQTSGAVGDMVITTTASRPPYTPLNSMNHGYFVSHLYDEWGTDMALIDENYEMVAEFNPFLVRADAETGFIPEFENRSDYKEGNGFRGYYHDGDDYYNYGTNMVWMLGEKEVLVDFSLYRNMTIDTMDNRIVKAIYDSINLSDADYWLVQKGEQWGYIDHDGKEAAMFDDAMDFCGQFAVVVEDGIAYVINEEFEKVQELGEMEGGYRMGDLFVIRKGEMRYLYHIE